MSMDLLRIKEHYIKKKWKEEKKKKKKRFAIKDLPDLYLELEEETFKGEMRYV